MTRMAPYVELIETVLILATIEAKKRKKRNLSVNIKY